MSEFNAALGMLQMKYIDGAIQRRQEIDAIYREHLAEVPGIRCLTAQGNGLELFVLSNLIDQNYPIDRDALYTVMRNNNIHLRSTVLLPLDLRVPDVSRPSLGAPRQSTRRQPGCQRRALGLPMYPDLSHEDQMRVIQLVKMRG